MGTFAITRQHVNPDNEEHAAMCRVFRSVEGDFADAKLAMMRMVLENEPPARQVPFLAGLVLTSEPGEIVNEHGGRWVGCTWTDGQLQYQIRQT